MCCFVLDHIPSGFRSIHETASPRDGVCQNLLRLRLLRQKCQKKDYLTRKPVMQGQYWPLLADDYHRVLYCTIPKAGCTSFLAMIAQQTGRVSPGTKRVRVHAPGVLASLGLRYLNTLSKEEIEKRLESYTKVIVVRHPFDRLRSTHNEKFLARDNKVLYQQMYKRFVDSAADINATIPLDKFLTAVKERHHRGYYDRHWMSYTDLCHPCHIQYDYILKMETLTSDLRNVLPLFKNYPEQQVEFPARNQEQSANTRLEETSSTFRHLAPGLVKGLLKIYQDDFHLFGYGWDMDKGVSCSTGMNSSCC